MDFTIVLTIFFYLFSATLKLTIKKHITRQKNIVSDLAISAQKYPKIVTQEEKKFQ